MQHSALWNALTTLARNFTAEINFWSFLKNNGETSEDYRAKFSKLCASIVMRCLVLFNLLFLLQNLLDARYLWAGMALPPGMTYASYAHRGAYPLIATALLAAVFVLLCFQHGNNRTYWKWPRILVYAWLAQNIFLVGSAIMRLTIYVSIYRLTLLRVSAMIWMLLVAAGLIWIIIKVIAEKDGIWLINVNVLTLCGVLMVCSYLDLNGFVAVYNVRHCSETAGDNEMRQSIDLQYLASLGPEALPALQQLLDDCKNKMTLQQRLDCSNIMLRLKEQLQHPPSWQTWTWRMAVLRHEYNNATAQ